MCLKRMFLLFIGLTVFVVMGCEKEKETGSSINIAVFIPGVRAVSPVYNMLAEGAEQAAKQAENEGKKVNLDIIEAGTAQAEWGQKLFALAAEKKYSLIISSNPAMPEIAAGVAEQFPDQKFLFLDAYKEGNPQIATFQYNQREQAYTAGYIAALVSSSNMQYANEQKKIGLIAGQEYPAMLNVILPAYLEGAKAAGAEFEVDFRIVGNWYDAAKGAELASAMYKSGVDVIMPICGGANQGVITAAKEHGFYIAWFDDNGFSKAQGYVISSSVMKQKELAYEQTLNFINGKFEGGKASILGMKDGYVNFVTDDSAYIETIPEELRSLQSAMLEKINNGELDLSVN